MVDQRINGLQAPGLPRAFPGPDETQGALGELLGHGSKILCDWLEATNNHGPRPAQAFNPSRNRVMLVSRWSSSGVISPG